MPASEVYLLPGHPPGLVPKPLLMAGSAPGQRSPVASALRARLHRAGAAGRAGGAGAWKRPTGPFKRGIRPRRAAKLPDSWAEESYHLSRGGSGRFRPAVGRYCVSTARQASERPAGSWRALPTCLALAKPLLTTYPQARVIGRAPTPRSPGGRQPGPEIAPH